MKKLTNMIVAIFCTVLITGVSTLFIYDQLSMKKMIHLENKVVDHVNNIRLEIHDRGAEIHAIQRLMLKADSMLNKEIAFRYSEEIVNTALRYNSITSSLLTALIYQESKFNYKAESHAGAQGLGQIMPETAVWICKEWNIPYHKDIVFDPIINIRMAAWYLDWLYHNSKVVNKDIELTLAYYNGGPRQAFRYSIYRKELEGIKLDKLEKIIE